MRYPDLFSHIEQARTKKTLREHVADAEQLAADNGGVLQNSFWLQNNGYRALYMAMRTKPALFSHLVQERKFKQPEEWVPIAEQLAADNGGSLPNYRWLTKEGYNGLPQIMKKYPNLFSHITQNKLRKTSEEWIPIAEQLATENGGLPSTSWLIKNGYNGLYEARKKHPHFFSHILTLAKASGKGGTVRAILPAESDSISLAPQR